jgi:hypothetical protein
MVLIESTELIDSLSLLLRISQDFREHEISRSYEDIIRLIRGMENEILREEGGFECFRLCKDCKCIVD